MDHTRLRYLFTQYENEQASDQELDELFAIITSESEKSAMLQYFEDSIHETGQDPSPDIEKWRPVIAKIVAFQDQQPTPVRSLKRWWKYAVAAIITVLAGISIYYLQVTRKDKTSLSDNQPVQTNDVAAPASTRAFVTLADGSKIVLDSFANGELAKQGNAQLVKLADGTIIYQGTGGEPVYNTLNNPRGSKVVSLVLADGSTVWLNAASSIRYPVSFSQEERIVEITGEAYFEVTSIPGKNMGKIPFIVRKGNLEVKVLGTHFNVNAYDNETDIKVTLMEGSVQVQPGNISKPEILRPGQQAEIYPDGKLRIVDKADTSRAMAWKNGYFDFNNAGLPVMMRQLERWYDITVNYNGQVPGIVFRGQMDRNVQLKDVIRFLKTFGIKASLQDRTLIISGS